MVLTKDAPVDPDPTVPVRDPDDPDTPELPPEDQPEE